MRKRSKRLIAGALSVVTAMGLLTGCGAGGEKQAKGDDKKSDEVIELKWYTRFDDQKDTQMVNDELNKILKEKIGCTVKIMNIPAGTYNDKMPVILGGREECDIVFAGTSFADYWGNAQRGAFLPLNDLLEEYGKETYEAIPEKFWDGVKLDGEIYGVINYQIENTANGFVIRQDIIDKYGIDMDSIKKLEDIEPYLEKIHQDDPSMVAIEVNSMDTIPMIGYDEIGTANSPGAVMIGDDSLKVVNQYETQEWRDYVDLMRKWYEAGYIQTDAATATNQNDLKKAGKEAMIFGNVKPGGEQEAEVLWGRDMVQKQLTKGRVLPSKVSATMNCISSTSKHPEKAMEFLNLLNTDKEVYNMVCFGIEGVHYNKVDDNRIEMVENSGYQPNKAWSFGNQFNAYVYGDQPDTVWEDTIKMNEESDVSELLGFVFDQEPVKNQVAQCQSVVDQYYKAIVSGSVDPDKYIPEFLDKLEQAGGNEIIAEKQKQIDEWKANK